MVRRLTPGWLALLALAVLVCFVGPAGALGGESQSAPNRTLVLLDDMKLLQTHSMWFEALARDARQELFFAHVYNSQELSLMQHGSYLYDSLLLLCPTAQDFGDGIHLEDVIAFMDSGRNVFVLADETASDPVRDIANECGIDFDAAETRVQDHVHYLRPSDRFGAQKQQTKAAQDASSSVVEIADHSLLLLAPSRSSVLVGAHLEHLADPETAPASARVLYRGLGHVRAEGTSRNVEAFLQGAASTYSHPRFAPGAQGAFPEGAAGAESLLVSGVQARNNARAVFAGSLDMCSNEFLMLHADAAQRAFQQEFCLGLAEWAFQQRGRLRLREFRHARLAEDDDSVELEQAPERYRIRDRVRVDAFLEEWRDRRWQPYVTPADRPLQLEFTMVYPYHRLDLNQTAPGHYTAVFTVPDVYGVFKFVIDYHRPGYSNLEFEQVIPVRPFYHTEYERFIGAAYPYYASVFSIMAAFVVFVATFLYVKDDQPAVAATAAGRASSAQATQAAPKEEPAAAGGKSGKQRGAAAGSPRIKQEASESKKQK